MMYEPSIGGIPLSYWELEALLALPDRILRALPEREEQFIRTYLNCAVWHRHVAGRETIN